MTPSLLIMRARLERDLEGILAVDAVTFTNPWTRQMYEWEAGRGDVSRLFVVYPGAAPAETLPAGETGAEPRPGAPLIGYCAVWVIFDELHINNLAVHPDWRRRGIARRLLEFVLAEGRRAGALHATLEVRRSNEAALKLYDGLGFSVGGVRTGYYSDPDEDALVLWRRPGEHGVPPDPSSSADLGQLDDPVS